MPTKKKRVGFIPREEVMKIIDKLSKENNLSNSKIISILVEEALSKRGIFNQRTGKIIQTYQEFSDEIQDLPKYAADLNNNQKPTINTKSGNQKNSGKTTLLNQINQETFDLQTYKKFLLFLKFHQMMDEYET